MDIRKKVEFETGNLQLARHIILRQASIIDIHLKVDQVREKGDFLDEIFYHKCQPLTRRPL